jgi:hypothetical protein
VLTNGTRNFNADSHVGFVAKDYPGTERSATGGKRFMSLCLPANDRSGTAATYPAQGVET